MKEPLPKLSVLLALLVLSVILSSTGCATPGLRYIGYRLSPDRVTTEGDTTIKVPADLQGHVTVYLDRFSVPHIRSDNEHDLYFALGYMQARDRRFQLEMFKLLGQGRLREMIGELDRSGAIRKLEIRNRMLGFYQDAAAMYESAPRRDKALLDAFSEGINAATCLEPLPMEFQILGYRPEPWRPQDSLVIVIFDAFSLCKDWEMELARLELALHQLRTGATIERALEIYKPWYAYPPFLYGGDSGPVEFQTMTSHDEWSLGLPSLVPELSNYLRVFAAQHPLVRRPLEGSDSDGAGKATRVDRKQTAALSAPPLDGAGSNNWAVDGGWTGTGKGALASDPHMAHMLPPVGYLFHLDCDGGEGSGPNQGYRVIGGTFVGIPGVVFGTNGSVAWGVTSNWADVTDLYVELPVPGRQGFYYYRGEELPFTTRTEQFRVRTKRGFKTESYLVRETVHGVVLNDFIDRISEAFPLVALARNRSFGAPLTAVRDLYKSTTADEARVAVERLYLFSGHWALADSGGHIAYEGSEWLPRRTRHLGTFPVPGWNGVYDWTERVPVSRIPHIVDPKQGFLATSNQEVYDPFAFPFPINLEGNAAFRYRRIMELLGQGRGGATPVDAFSRLQTDSLFVGWRDVYPFVHAALAPLLTDSDAPTRSAVRILLGWDGRCGANDVCQQVAPTLFNALIATLMRTALEDEVSDATLQFYLTYINIGPFLYGLLEDPQNPAWDDRRTPRREGYDEVLRAGFREAVAQLRAEYGDMPRSWKWERVAPFVLKHLFGSAALISRYLNRGPFETRGMAGTVFLNQSDLTDATHFPIKDGPVLRIAVDLDDLTGSAMCLPGGESGRPSSPHYDDMLPLYRTGKGVSMDMDIQRLTRRSSGRIEFRGRE